MEKFKKENMESGLKYHIYNHANGNEDLFREADNYRYFLQQYQKYIHPVVKTFAFCLLPNHFHFLVEIKGERNISELEAFEKFELRSTFPKFQTLEKFVSKQFSNLFSSYTQAFNKVYNRKGSLFIKNFKRKEIGSDTQFQDTFLYINLNAVKHGFTESAENWEWSSCKAYQNLESESLLDRSEAIVYFDVLDNMKYCFEEKSELILNLNLE